jgi:hypothetical protein
MIRGLILLGTASALCLLAFSVANNDDAAVPYPEGYRSWALLHGTLIGPKHGAFGKKPCEKPCTGGIFYFYANEKAMEGFRSGRFADGSIIADEVLETWGDEKGNAKEGPRRGVGVMVKDSRRYSATEGWGFGKFSGDSKVEDATPEERKACFTCHIPKKDRVFTEYHER